MLLSRIEQQLRLCDDLAEAAQALASQRHQPEAPPSPTDALESFVTHDRRVPGCTRARVYDSCILLVCSVYVPEETSVRSSNFDSYCEDIIMKRLHVDVDETLSAMCSGFNGIQPVTPALLEMDCSRLQKKLFPLDPVTIAAFKANARGHYDSRSPQMVLFWKILEEDLSDEQLAGLFYFATNFHTLCNATQHISINIDSSIRDGLPRAATCSWSLRLPNYMVSGVTGTLVRFVEFGAGFVTIFKVAGDDAPEYPLSRARMLEGLIVAGKCRCICYFV